MTLASFANLHRATTGRPTNRLTGANRQSILEYLPVCEHGSILITTRSKHTATQLVDREDVITISPMDEEHAILLLEKKLGQQHNGEDIAAMARELDFIPLAITQAAAYIQQRVDRWSVQQYLERLRKNNKFKMSLLDQDGGNLRRDKEASNSVLLTWQISFEHIREVRPSAADLLSLMSLFDRQAIPESLLLERSEARYGDLATETAKSQDSNDSDHSSESDVSEDGNNSLELTFNDEFEDDMTMLLGYSFIGVTTDAAAFEMHRLVQLATLRWLEAQEQLERWKKQFIVALNYAFPSGEYENWTTCQALFPHARSALRLKFQEPAASLQWAAVMYKAAWYAIQKGASRDAEAMAQGCTKLRAKQLGDNHPDTLASIEYLGRVLLVQGELEAAEEMQRRALEGRQNVLGKNHLSTLTSVHGVAVVLGARGRYEAAEEMHRRALKGYEKVLGTEHPWTLKSAGSLAITYWEQGRWQDAEELDVQVIGDSQDEARSRPSRHADEYSQPRINRSKSRAVGGVGAARSTGVRDSQDEARSRPSRHADKYSQPRIDVSKSRVVGGGGAARSTGVRDEQDEAGSRPS